MRRVLLLCSLIVVSRCAAPPPPVAAPPAPAPPVAAEETVKGSVRVTASSLNVRERPSTDAAVVVQVKKGTSLDVLDDEDNWMKVRLADGTTGWVSSRFVSDGSTKKTASKSRKSRSGCPADSDYAFSETPTLAFSDSGGHGLVVVEATVNAKGVVTATKVISNTTGDEALGFLTEREIRSAKFTPPIRDCVARSFIFTYRRTY